MIKISKNVLSKLVDGDEKAFNIVYDTYYRLIKHITFSYVKDNETADDLTLETFAKLWNNRDKIKVETKNFMYYVTQIAHNLCINYVKREQSLKISYVEDYKLDEVASKEEHSELDYTNEELLVAIKDIVDSNSYDILILHYVHGLKYKEIALLKNVATTTITVQASRAIKKIKERIRK